MPASNANDFAARAPKWYFSRMRAKSMKSRRKQPGKFQRIKRGVCICARRAGAIARLRLAKELIACEVFDKVPSGYGVYERRKMPENCWYVLCGPRTSNALDGSRTLLAISKRTGRVLFRGEARSG